jgi:hypothetical protein
MNELELIRTQLNAERRHAAAVANAGSLVLATQPDGLGAREEFREACVEYLVCVLAWFEERDRRVAQLAHAWPREHPARAALDEVLARPGRSREALEKLEGALDGGDGAEWREFAHFFHALWSTRRDALDALLGAHVRVGDWRTLAGIDADTILEERVRYARVRAVAPDGVPLAAEALPAT